MTGTLDHEVRIPARIVGGAQPTADRAAQRFHRPVLELPDRFFESTGLSLGVRHRRQSLGPVEVRAFLAADLLERHHTTHGITEPE